MIADGIREFMEHDWRAVRTAGDEIEGTVSWNGGALSQLSVRPVRLQFRLADADLYSLRFSASPVPTP